MNVRIKHIIRSSICWILWYVFLFSAVVFISSFYYSDMNMTLKISDDTLGLTKKIEEMILQQVGILSLQCWFHLFMELCFVTMYVS